MSSTPLRAVRVDLELWEKARTVAERNNETMSSIIRDALRQYIEDNQGETNV